MYGKLFAQMYDGSLYGKWQALVTFQQLIVLCDVDGVVDMTPQALAARTSIPLEIIQQGLADLEQPDPHSRTPTAEGRRIVRVSDTRDWGWHITNYAQYRQIRTAEERRAAKREYMRDYMREQRQTKGKRGKQSVNNVSHNVSRVNPPLAAVSQVRPIAEAEAEAEAEAITDMADSGSYSPEFTVAWKAYPKRPNNSKAGAWRAWQARCKAGEDPARMLAGVIAYAAYVAQESTEPRFVKLGATFFGPDRHYLNDFTPAATGPPLERADLHDESDIYEPDPPRELTDARRR